MRLIKLPVASPLVRLPSRVQAMALSSASKASATCRFTRMERSARAAAAATARAVLTRRVDHQARPPYVAASLVAQAPTRASFKRYDRWLCRPRWCSRPHVNAAPRAARHNLAAADLVDDVRATDQRRSVCHDDARDRHLRDKVGDHLLVLLIEICGALVEEQDLRVA